MSKQTIYLEFGSGNDARVDPLRVISGGVGYGKSTLDEEQSSRSDDSRC